jgi:FHS family L-fucose permease-like MFS transporter
MWHPFLYLTNDFIFDELGQLKEAARMSPQVNSRSRQYYLPIALIVSLFFLWGLANNLNDVLIAQFRKAFELADWQSGLVQSAFYLAYFLFAVPASLFVRKFGYKGAIVFGLAVYGVGALLFYPAAELGSYAAFLGALFVIASGLTFLETSANPLITLLGTAEGAERRLNLAQAFNPLGSITGVLIGREFILSAEAPTGPELTAMSPDQIMQLHASQALSVQTSYLVLGIVILLWALAITLVRFPPLQEGAEQSEHEGAPSHPGDLAKTSGDFPALLRHRYFWFGVVAQFAYVGAQVGIWSFLIRYSQHAVSGMNEQTAATCLMAALVAFMVGRFVGTAMMGWVKPILLTSIFAGINVVLCAAGATLAGWPGIAMLVASSFFMSIMYPTIFAISIKGLGPLTKLGSSVLVMSIIGGAIIPVLMGRLSDLTSITSAMLMPGVCFLVVGAFAVAGYRNVLP